MAFRQKTVLLFNPWIHDFAAYDFWCKPIGLLYIGAILRQLGYSIFLIDCLDRYLPDLANEFRKSENKSDGSGKFIRQEIEKPSVLKHIPRTFCRYGLPPDLVMQLLNNVPSKPDVILLTSFMTYWYTGVMEAVHMIRSVFPSVPILLGGIYATLCRDHAKSNMEPDYLITGEGETKAVQLVSQITNGAGGDFCYSSLDDLPFPAFDLYHELKSVALLASRGCPNQCSFCASKLLMQQYRRRSVENVMREIEWWFTEKKVHNFAFFDDALLLQKEKYIKPLLKKILSKGLKLNFHTPNGLTPRFLDAELAELFYTCGFQTVRLSFESSDENRQKKMFSKVTNAELEQALNNLENAGFKREKIGVYVLMGLPDQKVEEVEQSALFVHHLGAKVNMASFSPIPGTLEWDRTISEGLWDKNDDVLLTNSTIFPVWSKTIGYNRSQDLLQWSKQLNAQLDFS